MLKVLSDVYMNPISSSTDRNIIKLSEEYTSMEVFKEHVAVVFETTGWLGEDAFTIAALVKIIGGGTSFSAGGPGKGIFSRMYERIMNVYGWVESADVLQAVYMDTGLIGIYATCKPGNLPSLLEKVCQQLKELARDPFTQPSNFAVELERAKNQLKAAIFMALEQRSILFEDIGRQVLVYGKRYSVEEVCNRIDNVTVEDCGRAALKLISGTPTVVALGENKSLSKLISYDVICQYFQKK